MSEPGQTYAASGVDYASIDPIKVLAQTEAAQTAANLNSFSAQELTASRGESAYVWEEGNVYRSLVIEGLGSKNLVADVVRKHSGRSHYDSIAQDTIAMIVNDLIVVGALPQVINAYWAVGDSHWMNDKERASDLINGWAAVCQTIGATWGGGETPTLKDIVNPETIDLAGSAVGIIDPKERLVLGDKLTAGDKIVLIESSGIHANGITFVRKLAEAKPDIYQTKLKDGRSFGETLLTPTHLYVNLVKAVLEAELDVHYMVNITGHGWRKLMRATKDFTYNMHQVPPAPEEFNFIKSTASTSDQEMYGNFNMGAGYAIYLPESQANKVVEIAQAQDLNAWVAGTVETGPRQVVIEPINTTFGSHTLEVRS